MTWTRATGKRRSAGSTHLSDHDGEGKDADKVVDELKDDLKEGGRVRQAADGDQCLHSKVVAADVTEGSAGERDEVQGLARGGGGILKEVYLYQSIAVFFYKGG